MNKIGNIDATRHQSGNARDDVFLLPPPMIPLEIEVGDGLLSFIPVNDVENVQPCTQIHPTSWQNCIFEMICCMR